MAEAAISLTKASWPPKELGSLFLEPALVDQAKETLVDAGQLAGRLGLAAHRRLLQRVLAK